MVKFGKILPCVPICGRGGEEYSKVDEERLSLVKYSPCVPICGRGGEEY